MKPPEEYLRVPCATHAPVGATMVEHCRACETAAIRRAQLEALEEAARLICPGCADGLPLGMYYGVLDEWRLESAWKANDPDDKYRAMELDHGYGEDGDPIYCQAHHIWNVIRKLEH